MPVDLNQLQQEITNVLPNLQVEILGEKIHIHHFGIENLTIEIDNRIIFRFYKITNLNPQDVGLYLQTKMNFERISRKYLKEDSFYLYPNDSFNPDAKGSFEKRMFIIRTLMDAFEALKKLKNELEPEKNK